MTSSFAQTFLSRVADKSLKVGVVGMGYVGLPLAEAFAAKGLSVMGFDIDAAKVADLMAGKSYIRHIPGATIARMVASKKFEATADFRRLGEADAILICVPTPLTRHREPDVSYIVSTTETIAEYLRPGQLIALESTTYPGTTAEVMKPILERKGMKSGKDFFLAYSPEREDPANPQYTTATIPKVVGGEGPDALAMADALYGAIVTKTVPVSSVEVAEAVKLTENIFRSINIALVNELKIVYSKMGIDVWEVIDAAKTKPFGFMPFYPGPGLGGHCIPIDPFYLTWKAREYGSPTRFIELSGEINTSMPQYVVDRLAEALNDRFAKSVKGAKILLVGLAYKKNVDDIRESPAFALIELLEARGAKVDYYDPFVPFIHETREHKALAGRRSVAFSKESLAAYDCALICTDHDEVDYQALVENSRLVVDSRNATKKVSRGRDKIVKA